jgi:hypothetical protein
MGLFGAPEEGIFSLDETRTDDIPNIFEEDSLFTEEEIRKVVFLMEHNKAPGPYGFPTKFYQNLRDIIKLDLLDLFSFIHSGQLELFHLNFGKIIFYLRLREQKRSNNTDISIFLTLVLNFSPKSHQSGYTQ